MFQVSWGTMFYLYNMLIIITLMSTTIIKYSDEGMFLSEKVMLHIISFSILKWLFHVQKLFSEAFIYRSGYLLLEMHLSVFFVIVWVGRHQVYIKSTENYKNHKHNFLSKIISITKHIWLTVHDFLKISLNVQYTPASYIYFYELVQKDEKTLRPLKHKQQRQTPCLFSLQVCGQELSSEMNCGDLLGTSWLVLSEGFMFQFPGL